MSAQRPRCIAIFLGTFPVVSETFILRQITGLLRLGHEVDIYADNRANDGAPLHPEIEQYRLLERATFMRAPAESIPWEMPVRPLTGCTWLPGAATSTSNWYRAVQAAPAFLGSFVRNPKLTRWSLSTHEFGFQAQSLSTLYRLATLNRTGKKYDVLHAHFGPVGNSFRLAREVFNAPLIVSFHGYDAYSIPKTSGRDVYQKLFRDADAITVNSGYMQRELESLGCSSLKLKQLPYGVEVGAVPRERPTPSKADAIRVLTIGRLVEKKGIEYSIRAFAQVAAKYPQARYDIVGDGPLHHDLARLIAAVGLVDRIKLHGALAGESVRQLLSEADIFVLASVTAANGDCEGTPVSLLEAQACGVPVISTKHTGIPEIVLDGKTGFLVSERDVQGLTEKLEWFLSDPALRAMMGQEGIEFMRHSFGQEHCLSIFVDLIDSVRLAQL